MVTAGLLFFAWPAVADTAKSGGDTIVGQSRAARSQQVAAPVRLSPISVAVPKQTEAMSRVSFRFSEIRVRSEADRENARKRYAELIKQQESAPVSSPTK